MKSKKNKNSLSIFIKLLIVIIIGILIYIIWYKYSEKIQSNNFIGNSSEIIETINMENDSNSDTNNHNLSQDIIFREKSIQEWENLAFNFYETNYGYRPGYAESYYTEENNLLINLYDVFNDHRSSCEWYEIDKDTGITTNMFLEEVNLNTNNL